MKTAVCVAVGGALGALARYGLSHLFGDPAAGAFPIATFAANIAGSLLIGLLGGFAAMRPLPGALRECLGTGLLGGFTTLSAFGVETVRLAQGQAALAVMYAGLSVTAGLGAAAAGHALAKAAFGAARRDAA